jgi:hypothetical protein
LITRWQIKRRFDWRWPLVGRQIGLPTPDDEARVIAPFVTPAERK